MAWNNTGTSVLVKSATEEGSSYYGDASLYFLRADGEEASNKPCTYTKYDSNQ